MIDRICIRNFQSHKDSEIRLDEGVNVLCGESDNGKSAVMRAVKWVCVNRPLGTDLLNSSWNEKFTEEMSVTIWMKDGSYVRRFRKGSKNGYVCSDGKNEVELNAVGSDVPPKVSDMLRLSDVNFQFQMDSPYLLSMSSSEASQYLNKIVNLDGIDEILSRAEANKRGISSSLKMIKQDISSAKTKLESLSWLDEALEMKRKVEAYDNVTRKMSDAIFSLGDDIREYEMYSRRTMSFDEETEMIDKIEGIKISDTSELEDSIIQFERLFSVIERNEAFIKAEMAKLPDVCPICGSRL